MGPLMSETISESRAAPLADALAKPALFDRFLTKHQVLSITGFSPATLWREVKAGRFPSPVPISQHRKGYQESAVRAWFAEKLEGQRKAA